MLSLLSQIHTDILYINIYMCVCVRVSCTHVCIAEVIMYSLVMNNVQLRIVLQDKLHLLHNLLWTKVFREASHAMGKVFQLNTVPFPTSDMSKVNSPTSLYYHWCCERTLLNCLIKLSRMFI